MFIVYGFYIMIFGIYFYKLIINIEYIFFYILLVYLLIKVEIELYIFLMILIKYMNDNIYF